MQTDKSKPSIVQVTDPPPHPLLHFPVVIAGPVSGLDRIGCLLPNFFLPGFL